MPNNNPAGHNQHTKDDDKSARKAGIGAGQSDQQSGGQHGAGQQSGSHQGGRQQSGGTHGGDESRSGKDNDPQKTPDTGRKGGGQS